MIIDYNKIKPINSYEVINGERRRAERVLIKFQYDDIQRMNMMGEGGMFYMSDMATRQYENSLEFGYALATSNKDYFIKKGDYINCAYDLLAIKRVDNGNEEARREHHPTHIGSDLEGNEYVIPTCQWWNLTAKINKDGVEPIQGWIFLDIVELEAEDRVLESGLILPNGFANSVTDSKFFRSKILAINELDKKELILSVGDIVYVDRKSYRKVKVNNREYLIVPTLRISLVEESVQKNSKSKMKKVVDTKSSRL
jgi:co-chaperonin GroES (HSP10)